MPVLSRFSKALLLAAVLHAGTAFVARAVRSPSSAAEAGARRTELVVEIEQAIEAPSDEATAATAEPAPEPAARHESRGAPRVPAMPGLGVSDGDPTTGSIEAPTASAAPADSARAVAPAPPRAIDLGLDGRILRQLPHDALAPPRDDKSDVQRRLEASLAADDVRRGLARGNALIGSFNSATRAHGPTRGEAVVRVTLDGAGNVGAVELLNGSESEWSEVLRTFRRQAKQKRVRVPPGARGLRVTFALRARVQLPSGAEAPVSVKRPSLAPDGLVPGANFDVADLSGNVQRLVSARVLSEEVL